MAPFKANEGLSFVWSSSRTREGDAATVAVAVATMTPETATMVAAARISGLNPSHEVEGSSASSLRAMRRLGFKSMKKTTQLGHGRDNEKGKNTLPLSFLLLVQWIYV